MPNHCESDLTIIGNETDIQNFLDGLDKKEPSILKAYFPCPEELKITADGSKHPELFEKFGANDWYDWCNNNWGTKWGDYDLSIKNKCPTSIFISFRSAWAPPIKGLTEVSKKFPELSFEIHYYECGMEYQGYAIIKDGEVLETADKKYKGSRGG